MNFKTFVATQHNTYFEYTKIFSKFSNLKLFCIIYEGNIFCIIYYITIKGNLGKQRIKLCRHSCVLYGFVELA